MKLLLDNILSTTTLSSLHEDVNNPLTNLYHVFLRNRYMSTSTSDIITIELDSMTSINSLYYSFTNATSLQFKFLDADGNECIEIGQSFNLTTESGNQLTTELGNPIIGYQYSSTPESIESFHFPPTMVKTIKVIFSGSDLVYLGGLAIGTTYAPPFPSDAWTEPFDDRSIMSESQSGQILQEYVEPLRIYEFVFEGLTRTELNTLRQTYTNLGRGKPIWIELMNDHDEIKPLYGYISESPATNHNRTVLTINFKFKEAR